MIISTLVAVTFFTPGVFLHPPPFGWFEHGPPPFGLDYGPPGHGPHGRGPYNHGPHGNGPPRRRGPPPFSHGRGHDQHGHDHGHGQHGHGHGHKGSSEEYFDYDDNFSLPPITTKRPLSTKGPLKPPSTTPKPVTTQPSTTTTSTDYGGLIDIRLGRPDDRRKRSTKTADSSTTEIQERQLNFLGHYPVWNTPDPIFKPYYHFSARLSTCVQKKFDCVPVSECKSPPRDESHAGFCRWVHDEPYVCCEKPKGAKLQNQQQVKCGRRKTTEYSQAIVGGAAVSGGTGYPWMVAIGEMSGNDSVDWYCGGALIGERTVTTAAHCISRRKADVIRVGEINLSVRANNENSNVQQISVCRTLRHPLYRQPLLYNDIALLFLDEPVEFTPYVRPICLSQTSVPDATVALLSGWGQLGFANKKSEILQEVTVKVFNNSYCDKQYSITQASKRNFPRGILDTQLCAGDEEGGKDACQGDSGAPLVAEEEGSLTLIGLVSAGIGCGSKTFPGVYTRISAFSPWILENVI